MATLLRLTALLCALWVAALLAAPFGLVPDVATNPIAASLSNTLAAAQFAFAVLLLAAARDPKRNLPAVGAAIVFVAGKVLADLYHALVLLPPDTALFVIADLILSFSLLVGLLEALPRTVSTEPA